MLYTHWCGTWLTRMFCSLAVFDPRVGLTMAMYLLHLSVLCHCDLFFHWESCPRVDVVCQACRGLPRLRASGIVPCIISFSRQLPCFYRAMLCIRSISHGPVSVCLSVCLCLSVHLSVTSRSSTKMAKRMVTQTTPHDTPGSLVFWSQRSPRNLTGVTPYESAECKWGGSKSATFDK